MKNTQSRCLEVWTQSHYLEVWTPENPAFWDAYGKPIAWKTLWVTTLALTLSFATWFMVSAIVVKLPGIGFSFSTQQLFWLAAMPGLAGGTFRIVHTFLLPLYGTRHVITFATLIKLIPCFGFGFAVMNPSTPYWVFIVLAITAGFGGGDFSSFMPSTNLFFPKRLKGTALGIQAGIGNFGVSLAQFMTPALLSIPIYGASQNFLKSGSTVGQAIFLQNAALWYIPLLVLMTLVCWHMLRSIPLKASFVEQLDIFKDKHTWCCTITYVMTFGTFSGLAATFPMLIKSLYGGFPNAPDPLQYAFYGPLIGSSSRVLFGFLSDKIGGGILTTISGLGMALGCCTMAAMGLVAPIGMETFPLFVAVMLSLFFFSGIGNASTFRQFPIIFERNQRQAAGVIGWTAAVAAYGPFLFSSAIGVVIGKSGNATGFFWALLLYLVIATWINWHYYTRTGCERPS